MRAWTNHRPGHVHRDEPRPDNGNHGRIGRLLCALEARDEPFVLALDDLQRLSDPRSVALLEFLVWRGPPNLHLVLACRRFPTALDIGGGVLSGIASALTAGDLRFIATEIANFFGRRLSRRQLAALNGESAGWPMALRIHCNLVPAPVPAPASGGADDPVWVDDRIV